MDVFLSKCLDGFYGHEETFICSSLEKVQQCARECFENWDMGCNVGIDISLDELNAQFAKISLGENYIDGGSRATCMEVIVTKKQLDQ